MWVEGEIIQGYITMNTNWLPSSIEDYTINRLKHEITKES